jgi:hypothetical protein
MPKSPEIPGKSIKNPLEPTKSNQIKITVEMKKSRTIIHGKCLSLYDYDSILVP